MRYGPACFEPEGFASGVNLAVQYQQPASKQMMNIYHEPFPMPSSLTFIAIIFPTLLACSLLQSWFP